MTEVTACDHRLVCIPEIVGFARGDQASFARLVNDTHAEFGFSYDPVLDADLATRPTSTPIWPPLSERPARRTVIATVDDHFVLSAADRRRLRVS